MVDPEPGLDPAQHPLLGNSCRQRLFEFIETNAGICETELSLRTGVDRNTAKYHLKRMLRAGLISKRPEGRRVHFFPGTMPLQVLQRAVAGVQGETRRRILFLIHDKPELSWRAVGRHLGITARAVRWHLERLERAELIEVDRSSTHRKVRMCTELVAVLNGEPGLLHEGLPKHMQAREAFRSSLAVKPWESRELDAVEAIATTEPRRR